MGVPIHRRLYLPAFYAVLRCVSGAAARYRRHGQPAGNALDWRKL